MSTWVDEDLMWDGLERIADQLERDGVDEL